MSKRARMFIYKAPFMVYLQQRRRVVNNKGEKETYGFEELRQFLDLLVGEHDARTVAGVAVETAVMGSSGHLIAASLYRRSSKKSTPLRHRRAHTHTQNSSSQQQKTKL